MRIWATALLVILSFASGAPSNAFSISSLFGSPTKAVISIPDHFASALVVVAQQEHFYKDVGLEADVRIRSSGRITLNEMLQGRSDFAIASETPFVRATLAGQRPVILAGVAFVDGHHTIVARKASGIMKAKDLAGRRIGVCKGTTSEFFLSRVLRYYALPPRSAIAVYIEPENLVGALDRGEVDAVSTWKPWEYSAEDTTRITGDGIYTWNFFLVTRHETAEQRPELCRRMVEALVRAEHYAIEHRQELPARLATSYGMDPFVLERYWSSVRLTVALDHAMVRSLEDETRWVASPGDASNNPMPNYVDVMSFGALEKVHPSAVTVVHPERARP